MGLRGEILAAVVALVLTAAAARAEEMAPLTDFGGDPANGRAVAIARGQGNCLACHQLPIPEEPDHGNVGPDLTAVGARLSEGEIRLRVVDPKLVFPDTVMPAFHRTTGLHRVVAGFVDRPLLSAQDVEDVVAYLCSLK